MEDNQNNNNPNNTPIYVSPRKIIIFYVFVIILSLAIVIATILITYRYFYGDNYDYDEYSYTEDGRSQLLEDELVVNEILAENAISIDGNYIDGYTNELELVNISNNSTSENSIEDNNQVEENATQTENVIEITSTAEKLQLPKHDFEAVVEGLLPKYTSETQSRVKGIYSSGEKQIFLTFDDGPSKLTEDILDILKAYNVKATFFVVGSNVDLYPDITKRAYQEGHYIANHSYTHEYSSVYASVNSVLEEYNKTENSIQNAIGVSKYHSYLFRFPGGSSGGYYSTLKSKARELLDNTGVAYTNWNCMTGDAEGIDTVDEQLETLYETAGDNTSLVILMHDAGSKQTTVETLPKIIEHYQELGYEFKNYYDIMY